MDYTVNYDPEIVHSFRTDEELFRTAAEELKLKLNISADNGKRFYLAISGGSSPVPLFKLLAADYSDLRWNYLELFWVDERMVPPHHHESNYGNAKKVWLDHIDLPSSNVHFINGANEPADEVKRYGDEILKNLPMRSELPSFDWIWLGIGNDGHTASIFPGKEVTSYKHITGISEHPETGQKRITLTASVINNANDILFIVPGEGKKDILKRIFEEGNLTLPAATINPGAGRLRWFIKG